jgi:prepilin-type N-terminal cleavage/methylation domain-containing protein
MIYAKNNESGFTAVELLITLFVAAAFLATGYQLYSIIIGDSANVRWQAKASNIAYQTIRKFTPNATTPCTSSSPAATVPANSGLLNPSISVDISCPSGTGTTTISKLQVTVSYGPAPQEQVVHAIFVTK